MGMKFIRYKIIVSLMIVAILAYMQGCKFDVAPSQWDQSSQQGLIDSVMQIDPPFEAKAGVNTITITGKNFATPPDSNIVYVSKIDGDKSTVMAEIFSSSSSSITIYRPNVVSDSCMFVIASTQAIAVAQSGLYKIDPVLVKYGAFLDNKQLGVVAGDNNENIYVVYSLDKTIYRVAPTGQKTQLKTLAKFAPFGGRIGPDGKLYLMENKGSIDVVDVQKDTSSLLKIGPAVKCGDFDSQGNLFVAGIGTDLVTVAPDGTTKRSGNFLPDVILDVRVYGDYVYIVDSTKNLTATGSSKSIQRCKIDYTNHTVEAAEMVIDWGTMGQYSSRVITGISFSSDGKMYVATNSPDPILIVDLNTKNVSILYKNILPSLCKQLFWGNGTYLYMITGNTANPAADWTLHRVDTGFNGAPFY
jgi:hypothetical protein